MADSKSALLLTGACCAALCAWMATSWEPWERAWLAREVRSLLRRLLRACDPIIRKVQKRMASQSSNHVAHVSLGEVSEMIDVVRLGLTAGLSFDAALAMYCSFRTSRLSKLLGEAALAWRIGAATRGEALGGVARATGVRPLESFGIAVAQALALGAPLAETLQGQAREIRAAHRAAVEREIERAPVKLLVPVGTLILPALLLSIMGPLLAASGMV